MARTTRSATCYSSPQEDTTVMIQEIYVSGHSKDRNSTSQQPQLLPFGIMFPTNKHHLQWSLYKLYKYISIKWWYLNWGMTWHNSWYIPSSDVVPSLNSERHTCPTTLSECEAKSTFKGQSKPLGQIQRTKTCIWSGIAQVPWERLPETRGTSNKEPMALSIPSWCQSPPLTTHRHRAPAEFLWDLRPSAKGSITPQLANFRNHPCWNLYSQFSDVTKRMTLPFWYTPW